MNIFPAMQGVMGRWRFYVVKMSMRELADNVKFGADIYDDRTLDEAIQRVLDESRVKKDIVTYLIRQEDRFFSSVVVAALSGNPKWYPVTMEDDERFVLLRDDARFNDSFGVLSFDGTQDYYALDGQHRLSAIKALVDPNSDVSADAPDGFKNEEISVIVVVPSETETTDEFLTRYRRLFGNLNRYAKPMDNVTNIIMDEDDAFAIITRRLITDHDFFKYSGRQTESAKIKTKKGKNLSSTDSYFTSLEALYQININLLSSKNRKNSGWNVGGEDDKAFKRFRPDDEVIDALFEELIMYWDGILEELPILREQAVTMRDHSAPSGDGSTHDNILFWPIGQELLADIVRDLLNFRQGDPESPTVESIQQALGGLSQLIWDFHQVPWKNLVLIPDGAGGSSWRIRSEERAPAQQIAKRIVKWQIGLDELAEDEISTLKSEWQSMLLPALDEETMSDMWERIEAGILR
jgi:DNA sulfur modification protein DndB